MDKNLNVRVVTFTATEYDRDYLDKVNDRELSECALADGDSNIYETLLEFQNALNDGEVDVENNWIYFLTDLA